MWFFSNSGARILDEESFELITVDRIIPYPLFLPLMEGGLRGRGREDS